jgi:hypothetical protein
MPLTHAAFGRNGRVCPAPGWDWPAVAGSVAACLQRLAPALAAVSEAHQQAPASFLGAGRQPVQ